MGVRILGGDCRLLLPTLETGSVQCCVTSPPYFGLRSYMPDAVRLRDDLTDEQLAYVIAELDRLGILPTSEGV
ncbi:MAG: hypothetical protein E6Q97_19465 [Desulfurellales bacterium]|nr:MAG: hypothetical protein E6Q97_19465 [Desulfurellales bacterium]